LTVGIFPAEKTARPLLMEKQNADELITRDLAFRCAHFAFCTSFNHVLFLAKFNVVDPDPAGSASVWRIRI
jgi:hypothetical protein